MFSIRGTFQDGIARPAVPIAGQEGCPVIITFLDGAPRLSEADRQADWDRLTKAIEEFAVETGIGDLAHQHDHYLRGTPKKP